MNSTHILEPLEYNMSTATKEKIASIASLEETAKKIHRLIDEYDKSDTALDTTLSQH